MKKLLIFILFFCIPAYAGTGGTKTIIENGSGNYTSLTTWEAGEGGVLTSTAYAVISGSWTYPDTNAVILNGWTTYSTAPIIIQTTGLARHKGVFNDKTYRLQAGNLINQAIGITIYPKDVQIDGLQINIIGGALQGDYAISDYYDYGAPGSMCFRNISNCIITRSTTSLSSITNDRAVDMNVLFSSQTYKIWNNIFYFWGCALNYGTIHNSTSYIYNNTFYNCDTDGNGALFLSDSAPFSSSLYMYNNLVYGTTNNYGLYNFNANRQHTGNNVSFDGTSPDSAYRYQSASFVSNTSDYHLLSADTTAYKRGTTTAGLPERTGDINGNAIVNKSIGADDRYVTVSNIRKRNFIYVE